MTTNSTPALIEILLVDDDPIDILLTNEILKRSKFHARISTASDGEQALAFLRRQGPYADVPTPDLILLDVNMPRMDGLETLSEIKADAALRHIPVVVLTTVESERDMLRADHAQATCCVSKPIDLAQLTTIVKKIAGFWFTIVKLAPESSRI
jgi:CheY-like chemotaxis protein